MDFSVIGTILGALGIGSLITQYVMASRARREVRGGVLKHLAEVEEARWAGGPDEIDYRAFRKAVHALETAALIARIPRRAVVHYVVFAQAARSITQEYVDIHGYDEEVGSILFNPVAEVVTSAAQAVTRLAWSPLWGRIGLHWRLKRLREQATSCDAEEMQKISGAQRLYGELPAPLGLPAPDVVKPRPVQSSGNPPVQPNY